MHIDKTLKQMDMRNLLILLLLVAVSGNVHAFQRAGKTSSGRNEEGPDAGDTIYYNPVYALVYLYATANPRIFPESVPPVIQKRLDNQITDLEHNLGDYGKVTTVPQVRCPGCTCQGRFCCDWCPCTKAKYMADELSSSIYQFITPRKDPVRLRFSTLRGKKIPLKREVKKTGKSSYYLYTLDAKDLSGKARLSFYLSGRLKRQLGPPARKATLEVTLDEPSKLSVHLSGE